jgi:hypothetical protein
VTIATEIARGTRIPGDAPLQLSGEAVDQAAQNLKGTRLRWYDGSVPIGSGAAISAGPLPPGVNRIRLVARDPQGRSASATLTVTVARAALPFLHLSLPGHVAHSARRLVFHASANVSTTLTIGRRSFRLSAVRRRFTLAIPRESNELLLAMTARAGTMTTPFAARVAR